MTEAPEVDEVRDERDPGVADLVTWLREQIDEDERSAQADMRLLESLRSGIGVGLAAYRVRVEDAAHVASRNPARVLREVEAKRRVIDIAQQLLDEHDHPFWAYVGVALLRLGALPYADQPGYREEWRPEEW